MQFLSIAATLLAAIVGAGAAPSARQTAIWVPAITSPQAGDVWNFGETKTVTWSTADEPEGFNGTGYITLRYDTTESPFVIAHGFSLSDGQVDVTVPAVLGNLTWSIVLFGDSGNISPEFTINPVSPF